MNIKQNIFDFEIKQILIQLVTKIYQESPAWKLAYGEMQYAITLEMKYKIVNCK